MIGFRCEFITTNLDHLFKSTNIILPIKSVTTIVTSEDVFYSKTYILVIAVYLVSKSKLFASVTY